MSEINGYDVMIRMLEVIEKSITVDKDVISIDDRTKIRASVQKIDIIVHSKTEQNTGDIFHFNHSQIGAAGTGASAAGNTFHQHKEALPPDTNFEALAAQLCRLRIDLAPAAGQADQFISLGELAKAEQAAHKKDAPGLIGHLKDAGKWVWDKAQEIGVELVAEIIKKHMEP